VTLPPEIGGRAVTGSRPVSGGDINEAYAVSLDDGSQAFVKTRAGAAAGEYAAEAAGLRWLADGGALVPEILAVDDGFLALAWLEEGGLDAAGEEELGRRLATVHRAGAERFGAVAPPFGADGCTKRRNVDAAPTRIGPLVLPNDPAPDWPAFYGERRLRPLARQAGLEAAIAPVIERLPELAGDPEPPARLHGDLWSGNVLASGGRPYLIDPAAYGGHREVDLAMLELFGSPGRRTLAAYDEVWPRQDGHEERVALWQLLPLLVHAVLFGGSYVAAVSRTAGRYA
jgi:fructosamine-3-kinase